MILLFISNTPHEEEKKILVFAVFFYNRGNRNVERKKKKQTNGDFRRCDDHVKEREKPRDFRSRINCLMVEIIKDNLLSFWSHMLLFFAFKKTNHTHRFVLNEEEEEEFLHVSMTKENISPQTHTFTTRTTTTIIRRR